MEKWEIIRLCLNIFDSTWLVGLENVIMSMDEKLCVLLPEVYMAYEPEELLRINIARRPSLFIKDNIKFYNTWLKMEANINFLLRWRGILEDPNND